MCKREGGKREEGVAGKIMREVWEDGKTKEEEIGKRKRGNRRGRGREGGKEKHIEEG